MRLISLTVLLCVGACGGGGGSDTPDSGNIVTIDGGMTSMPDALQPMAADASFTLACPGATYPCDDSAHGAIQVYAFQAYDTPLVNVPVVLTARDGSFVKTVRTGSDGRASVDDAQACSTLSFVFGAAGGMPGQVASVFAVKPGDRIAMQLSSRPADKTVVNELALQVPDPAGVFTPGTVNPFVFTLGSDAQFVNTPGAASLHVYPWHIAPDHTVSLLAEGHTAVGVGAFAIALPVDVQPAAVPPPQISASLGAWRNDFRSVTWHLPDDTALVFRRSGVRYEWGDEAHLPRDFFDEVVATRIVDRARTARLSQSLDPTATDVTIDTSALPRMPGFVRVGPPEQGAKPSACWQLTGAPAGDETAGYGAIGTQGTWWTFVVPPDMTEVSMPSLPSELLPQGTFRLLGLRALDYSHTTSYDEVRGHLERGLLQPQSSSRDLQGWERSLDRDGYTVYSAWPPAVSE